MRIILIAITLLAGCSVGGVGVVARDAEDGWHSGHGVVVELEGRRRVVSVAHVASHAAVYTDRGRIKGRTRATEIRRVDCLGSEDLVVLSVAGRLPPAVTIRELKPGDSGEPLFDSRGRCIGLVVGLSRGAVLLAPLAPLKE